MVVEDDKAFAFGTANVTVTPAAAGTFVILGTVRGERDDE